MKWVVDRIGKEQTWYSSDVIDKIKIYILNVINKRPHSDNKVFEEILEIIENEEREK